MGSCEAGAITKAQLIHSEREKKTAVVPRNGGNEGEAEG